MAANDLQAMDPVFTVESDNTIRQVTMTGSRQLFIKNMGANGAIIRVRSNIFANANPLAMIQADGEVALLAGETIALDQGVRQFWHRSASGTVLRCVSGASA